VTVRALPATPVALALLAGAALLFVLWRQGRGRAGAGASVAGEIGAAAGGAVVDAAAGAVVGIGGAVGIPATDTAACDRAIADGRLWDASFACPASRFVGAVFNTTPPRNTGGATGSW
jgi:hypothetical protein